MKSAWFLFALYNRTPLGFEARNSKLSLVLREFKKFKAVLKIASVTDSYSRYSLNFAFYLIRQGQLYAVLLFYLR